MLKKIGIIVIKLTSMCLSRNVYPKALEKKPLRTLEAIRDYRLEMRDELVICLH